jgi:hypothetical protein
VAQTQDMHELESAAVDVTRRLPAAHTWTRRLLFRPSQLLDAGRRFLSLVYQLDVATLSDDDVLEAEKWTRVAINALEIHVMMTYGSKDVGECQMFGDVIARLRDTLQALERGLPIDPAKRPSTEQLREELNAAIRRSGIAC